MLHPAKRNADAHAVVVVDEDHASVNGTGGAGGEDVVASVDAAGEAVGDGVCKFDCVGRGGEGRCCC